MREKLRLAGIVLLCALGGAAGVFGYLTYLHYSNDHALLHQLVQIESERQQAARGGAAPASAGKPQPAPQPAPAPVEK